MLQAQSRQKDPLLQRLPSRSQLAAIRAPQRVNQPPQGRSLKRQQGKARRCQSRPRTKQQGSRTSSWEAQSRCSELSAPARTLTGESLSRQVASGSVYHMRLYTAIISKSALRMQVPKLPGKDASAWVGHPTVKCEHGCWMSCRASSSAGTQMAWQIPAPLPIEQDAHAQAEACSVCKQ